MDSCGVKGRVRSRFVFLAFSSQTLTRLTSHVTQVGVGNVEIDTLHRGRDSGL